MCKKSFIFFFPPILIYSLIAIASPALPVRLPAAAAAQTGGNELPNTTPCKDDMAGVLEAVKNRTQELDMREEKIRIEEERLKSLRLEIENRITELSKTRQKIEEILQAIKTEKQQSMEKLAKVYENMPPEEAASRIEKLNKDLAVVLLRTMKDRTAGKILAFVDPAKAAELTQELGAHLLNAVEAPSQAK